MLVEVQILIWSVFLGIIHIFVSSAAATHQRGLAWNISARDGEPKPLTGFAARLDRALQNYKETFPFFAAAVLALAVADNSGSLSKIGAGLYLGCRIFYIPLYAFGVPNIRTVIWTGSVAGIVMVAWQAICDCNIA